MENLAEIYYEKLKSSTSPAYTLLLFCSELFDITPDRSGLIIFKDLIKLFGRDITFYSIIDLRMGYNKVKSITGVESLLKRIVANRYERKLKQVQTKSTDMTTYIEERIELTRTKKVVSVPSLWKKEEDE